LEGEIAGADGPASVFIDIIGLPFTPLPHRAAGDSGECHAGVPAVRTVSGVKLDIGFHPEKALYIANWQNEANLRSASNV
jgi:hypothetical protein